MNKHAMIYDHPDLSVRTRNALTSAGLNNLAQVQAMSDADLSKIRNFGVGCLADLRRLPIVDTGLTTDIDAMGDCPHCGVMFDVSFFPNARDGRYRWHFSCMNKECPVKPTSVKTFKDKDAAIIASRTRFE